MKIIVLSVTAFVIIMGGWWLMASHAKMQPKPASVSVDIDEIARKAGDLPVTQVDSYM